MNNSRKPFPVIHENGIGYCTDTCPQHDGKRCRLTGFRPDSICEPWVEEVVTELKQLKESAS